MTLTLELTPAEETHLRREAQERGQEMTEYARAVLLPDDGSHAAADLNFWHHAGNPAVSAVWDNEEDDVYAELLPK